MSTRPTARLWLTMACLVLGSASSFAEGTDAGPIMLDIEPPAPLVIEAPASSRPFANEVKAPAAAPDVSLPDLPPVVVAVPAAESVPAPVTVEMKAPEPELSPAQRLAELIRERAAAADLPLPTRFSARDREGLAAAYVSGQPLWIMDGAWNPAANAVLDRLSRAAEDGLDAAEYPAPTLGSSPAELAEAELKLSAVAFVYARDARGGRIEPNRLGALITPKLDLPGVERVLATLAASPDAGEALHGFNPRYPGYVALRAKLAELRADRPVATAPHPRGTRLASVGTTASLGRVSPRLEGDIIANMERWRWLPSQVGERYVLVNVPEFRLRLVEDGRTIHETRVITGATATPTPVFSDLIEHAIVNPSWFVPPSILKKMDVAAAARSGYEVRQSRRGGTSVRMPPGPRNALGYIKFIFPNDHAVYLHDTPNRGLFGASNRALSHGCVRVENPFALGGKILGAQWSEGRLKSLIGSGERMIRLDERLPVHLAYFTVMVDEDGELRTFGDIYGYHGRVRRALGLGG